MVTEDSEKTIDSEKTMDSVVDLKSMDSGLAPKMMNSALYPNMMTIEVGMLGLDPKWGEDFDPKRTMDFALFGKVCYGFILPYGTPESVQRRVKLREHDDVKGLPPLEVIFFKDLVSTAWGWERLLPWMSGSLLFEDYFGYLEQYYRQNENAVFARLDLSVGDGSASLIAAAAKECMEREKELNAKIAGHGGLTKIAQPYDKLSQKIVDQALAFSNPDATLTIPAGSIVPAACFMCITQEAKLKIMTLSNMKADDVFSVELWQMTFEFGNKVRQVALKILINYRGPHSEQISAAMLGMAEEYSFACKLLDHKQHFEYRDEVSDISEDIRHRLLELLFIIHDTFPFQSAIDYDSIEPFRTAMGNKRTEHLSEPRKEIVSANEVSSATSDEIAFFQTPTPLPRHQQIMEVETTCEVSPDITSAIIPKTHIPTKSAARATPSSLSVNNYGFDDQSSTNYRKRKSIGGTQDSEAPSTQPSEQRNDSGITELGLQINNDDVAAPVTPLTELPTSVQPTSRPIHFGGLSDDESDEEKNRDPKKSKSTGGIQGS